MNVAIIGGSGFIGTHLSTLLSKEAIEFSILDINPDSAFPEKTTIVDIRNPDELRLALKDADVIVNLAAEHRDDVTPQSLYYDVNVTGSENVCNISAELDINRIIFTSSVAVYGEAPPNMDESGDCRPFSEYGRTKLQAEEVYRNWSNESPKRNLAIVRPTVVFGENNRGNVYNLFKQIADGRFLFVGSGRNHKAMAYVGNVSAFLAHIIRTQELADTWNYVDTPIPDMRHLVTLVRDKLGKGRGTGLRIPGFLGLLGGLFFDVLSSISGRKLPISRVRIKKFMFESSFSSEKALSTGFLPPFQLDESLNRVLSYEFSG